jgi:hypothetical protein
MTNNITLYDTSIFVNRILGLTIPRIDSEADSRRSISTYSGGDDGMDVVSLNYRFN